MRDGREDALAPVKVPVRPGNSYHLGPRWSFWMASLPLLGLVVAGALIAARGSDTVEVIDAAALPEVPAPLPTSVPTTVPPPISVPMPAPAVTPVVPPPGTASTTARAERFDDIPPVAPPVASSRTHGGAPGPLTADDCKDGRWQRWVDDRQQPFANQGRCIRFVLGRGQHPGW